MDGDIEPEEAPLVDDSPGLELSSNQTNLGFERTAMGADRTLMAIVRTSLSLIGFGFTINAAFQKLAEKGVLPLNQSAPRNFGLALIFIGIMMLVLGIVAHVRFQRALTARHDRLFARRLVHQKTEYRATPTFAVAGALLLVGLAAFCVAMFNLTL